MARAEEPDYTEDTVALALQEFISFMNIPSRRFSLRLFSKHEERKNGADAIMEGRIASFRPFYMQFKRPHAYPPNSWSPIVKDRKKLNLPAGGKVLAFKLRDLQGRQRKLQHNVLFELRERLRAQNSGDAAYVCPLFLNRDAYTWSMHFIGLRSLIWNPWRLHPWEMERVSISRDVLAAQFHDIPVFAEHVSIPPDERVSNSKHSYSFTERGEGICFHSPRLVSEQASLLSDWLGKIREDFLKKETNVSPDRAGDLLTQLMEDIDVSKGEVFQRDFEGGWLQYWLKFGDFLRQSFDIQQFAFVEWRHD